MTSSSTASEGRPSSPVLQHLDEGDEEVRHPLAQLLDEGVLVGRALVPVDGDPLVDGVAREVLLLAERLHHELLEVAGEEEEPVLVGEDDHVLPAAPFRLAVPGEGEEGGGVLPDVGNPRRRVAGPRPFEEAVDVEPLERGREEPDGGELRRCVRPTQSHIGKRASHFCRRASLSRSLPSCVTATACRPKSSPLAV